MVPLATEGQCCIAKGKGSGLTKPMKLSANLAKICGQEVGLGTWFPWPSEKLSARALDDWVPIQDSSVRTSKWGQGHGSPGPQKH